MPSRIQRRFCHIVAIEQTPSVPVRCIEVDAEDHLFLAGNNFAVTHNCFKGSSAILNTMLTILNEKTFHNGGVTKVPLQTVYAASNEIPQAEELSAFYDRFVLRFFVEPVRDNNSIRILFSGLPTVVFPTISLKELETEQKAAAAVTISTAMVDLLIRLRREIENEGFLVSDRKWVQATRVLKAFAHLNGHITVEDTDFDILCHVLWSAPEQRSKVRKVVMRVSNPFGEKLLDIVDGVKDIESQLDSGAGDAVESFMKVKHALKALNDLGDPNLNHRLSIAIEKVRTIQAAIAKKHLGLND
jgi:MoxR-like ATPase